MEKAREDQKMSEHDKEVVQTARYVLERGRQLLNVKNRHSKLQEMMELVHKRAQEAHKDIEKNAKKIYNFKNIRRFEIFWRNM
mgnify:CR=1 FL=1